MKRKHFIWLFFLTNFYLSFGQQSTFVDDKGTWKWADSNKEVRVFGVNYTLPFAHGYRAISYLNKNHKEAIDKDVYHLARLGIDGFRVHIWDAEVTDAGGNLIQTPQLDLLDYTLAKLKERGIKTVITPFKVGGNGYPEKDFDLPGFSNSLQKTDTYSGAEILQKQERYFTQLLNHVNPYTKIAYNKDPDIIALEINNEPTHDNGPIATAYINKMVDIIRNAGFKNPIFYNVSEKSFYIDDYLKANIQGCTFQWYPTGLVQNKQLSLNFLPNVDRYVIPFENKKAFQNKARIIYEFDPGDTNSATLFPAMARSFRQAKFQFAAQFAYDAIDLAFSNTEYQTHYLNLAYTPSKAISLKIANEVFHEVETTDNFGNYPENTTFRNTQINPEKNGAVYNSENKFFYSNSTEILPKNQKKIKQIAGVGSSSLIQYSGNGAYFLDNVEKGVWRLEIMPDVLWVNDPFEKASLTKTVAVLQENQQTMTLHLPDLLADFKITAINKDNNFGTKSVEKTFKILPGTYIIQANSSSKKIDVTQKLGNLVLNEYTTTKQEINQIYVVHKPTKTMEKNKDLSIEAQIVSPSDIKKVEVVWPSGYQKTTNYLMEKTDNFQYKATIPKSNLYGNTFNYHIVVYTENDSFVFPDNQKGNPIDWDFVAKEKYSSKIVQPEAIIVLFDATQADENNFLWPSQSGYRFETVSYKNPLQNVLSVYTTNLQNENADFTFKILANQILQNDAHHLNSVRLIVVEAASGTDKNQKVQIGLQQKNGLVFGKTIELTPKMQRFEIPFSELLPVPMVLLPRPYPGFQPYWFENKTNTNFEANQIEAIQISIGPGINPEDQMYQQGILLHTLFLN
jgi:hypothetical protein